MYDLYKMNKCEATGGRQDGLSFIVYIGKLFILSN